MKAPFLTYCCWLLAMGTGAARPQIPERDRVPATPEVPSLLSHLSTGERDAAPALQAAIDVSGASSHTRAVTCPSGAGPHDGLYIKTPLLIHNSNVKLTGDGRNACNLAALLHGPMIVVGQGTAEGQMPPPTVSPLLAGKGGAFVLAHHGSQDYFLRLRDGNTIENLSGPENAFTIEATVRHLDDADGAILGSNGGFSDTTDSPTGDILSWLIGNHNLTAKTRIGNKIITLQGGVLSSNVNHHIAVNYDGKQLCLFVDGTQKSVSPANGNW